jgi:hypothetical protein
VNKNWHEINIINRLNELYEDGYEICVGDQEHCYSIGKFRAIDRLIVWITQISYANEEIENQIATYAEYADTDKFEELIEEAEEGLIAYRKLHPNVIDFFIKSHSNKVTLKHCRYHQFQVLLLHKTALIKR